MFIRWIARLLLVVVVCAAAVTLPARPANACSCASGTPGAFLSDSDIGFIGSLAAVGHNADQRDPFNNTVYSFDVELWLNGDLESATVEIDSASDGAACGFEVALGGRAAVFAYREGERLQGGLCTTLNADVTLAALSPASTPGGIAAFAVAGIFDDGAYALLDAGGEPVGYSANSQTNSWTQIYHCPGGLVAVVLGFPGIAVTDLASMESIPTVDTEQLQQDHIIEDVRCLDPTASDVELLVRSAAGDTREIRRLASADVPGQPIPQQPSQPGVLVGDGGFVVVEFLDPGERLVAFDADGNRRVLGQIDRPDNSKHAGYESVAANPSDADEVVASEVTILSNGIVGRLVAIDVSSGAERVAVDVDASTRTLGWTDDGRLLTAAYDVESSGTAGVVLQVRSPDTLDVEAELDGWTGDGALVRGDTVWGSSRGSVVRGSFEAGTIDTTTILPSQATGAVLALTDPLDVAAASSEAPITPREPLAITEAEQAARANLGESSEPSSDSSSTSGIIIGAIVALLALAAIATAWTLTSRRRKRGHPEFNAPEDQSVSIS